MSVVWNLESGLVGIQLLKTGALIIGRVVAVLCQTKHVATISKRVKSGMKTAVDFFEISDYSKINQNQ